MAHSCYCVFVPFDHELAAGVVGRARGSLDQLIYGDHGNGWQRATLTCAGRQGRNKIGQHVASQRNLLERVISVEHRHKAVARSGIHNHSDETRQAQTV